MGAQLRADGLPSGPVMFLAEVIAEAIGEQAAVQDERNGVWWISGGCTPQSAGCKLNLRDVAEAVLVNLPDCGYGPKQTDLLVALKDILSASGQRPHGRPTPQQWAAGIAAVNKAEGRS